MSMAEREPPGWPLCAWYVMSTMYRRSTRAVASSLAMDWEVVPGRAVAALPTAGAEWSSWRN